MKRYTNILLDKTAKIVLCDPKNKQLFMDMILLLVGRKVADLKFLNIEQHGLADSDKSVNFDLLCRAAEYANLTIEQQQLYDKIMTTELDIIAQNRRAFKDGEAAGLEKGLRKGEEKGLRRGLSQGKAEGLAEGQIATAKRLIATMGLDPEAVAKELGVPKDKLQ